ncbi:Uncharacterised protein r2_g1968 [Pycnogonum litorale]
MTVHLFSAVSSPSCANYALKTTALHFKSKYGDKAAKFVENDFYMDDGLTSVASEIEAVEVVKNARNMCKMGGFKLHKFISNNKNVLKTIPNDEQSEGFKIKNLYPDEKNCQIERALGIQWYIESDELGFRMEIKDKPSKTNLDGGFYQQFIPYLTL